VNAGRRALPLLLAIVLVPPVHAMLPDAENSMRQFLARDDVQPAYRAVRRLEAENGNRSGWLEAVTDYSAQSGFAYSVTAEGGSEHIRSKVLRAVLDAERDMIKRGEAGRALLIGANYAFQLNGIGEDGLMSVQLSPRRKERTLVSGQMFLTPGDGHLVRVQGQLAKSPSFWIKSVAVVRTYGRVAGTVVPVELKSHAQLRLFGEGTLRMTYHYSHINGRPVSESVP
jgi:hypothetical protein